MSFLDNFKMAVGLKPKTEKYIHTTNTYTFVFL